LKDIRIEIVFLLNILFYNLQAQDFGQFNSLKSISNLVEIYPNPFKDNITVKCSNIEYCKLTVFDISGRQLLNLPITTTEQTFFLQELIPGAYLLQLSGKSAPFYFKLLKKWKRYYFSS